MIENVPYSMKRINDKWPTPPPFKLSNRELSTVGYIMKFYYNRFDKIWVGSLRYNYSMARQALLPKYPTYRKHPIFKKVKNYWNRKKLCIYIYLYVYYTI